MYMWFTKKHTNNRNRTCILCCPPGYVDAQGNLIHDIELPEGGGGGGGGSSAKRPKAAGGGGSSKKKAKTGGAEEPGPFQGLGGLMMQPITSAIGQLGQLGHSVGQTIGQTTPGRGIGGIFSSTLSSITMADFRRLLGGGGGGDAGGGAAAVQLGAVGADRGITTGFTGPILATAATPGGVPFNGGGAMGQLPEVAALSHQLPPMDAASYHEFWEQFKPVIQGELGEGRTLQQLVDPPAAPAAAAAAAGGSGSSAATTSSAGLDGSLVRGVVYSQSVPGKGGRKRGNSLSYGAALWDGARLQDHGTQGSLEAALETAASLAAAEESLHGDAALRDLLGGASGLFVPRAASLALFQAVGSFRNADLPSLDALMPHDLGGDGADAAAASPAFNRTGSASRRGRSASAVAASPVPSFSGGKGGKGSSAKRAKQQQQNGAGTATAAAAAAAAEPDYTPFAVEGDEEDLVQRGSSGLAAVFSKGSLPDMLRSLRSTFSLTRRGSGAGLKQ
jgi:hypothetical protein